LKNPISIFLISYFHQKKVETIEKNENEFERKPLSENQLINSGNEKIIK
jgi:hypothetical protein